MTRDAKLYYLHEDWQPLVYKIEQHKNYTLRDLVVIFDIYRNYPKQHRYAILSLHNDTDKIIEDFGATEADEKDLMRNDLHNYHGEPEYGDKERLVFLNKLTNPYS